MQNPEELIHYICESNIKLLQEYGLVSASEPLRTTAYGDAVARYYVQIETARLFLNIPNHAKISEIVRLPPLDFFLSIDFTPVVSPLSGS